LTHFRGRENETLVSLLVSVPPCRIGLRLCARAYILYCTLDKLGWEARQRGKKKSSGPRLRFGLARMRVPMDGGHFRAYRAALALAIVDSDCGWLYCSCGVELMIFESSHACRTHARMARHFLPFRRLGIPPSPPPRLIFQSRCHSNLIPIQFP
jgi:hypothetical protein